MPFLRSRTTACSRSPLASVRACLQSIIGAPVFSRSSFTWVAEIFTVDVLILDYSRLYFTSLPGSRWSLAVKKHLSETLTTNDYRPAEPLQTLTRGGRPARACFPSWGKCVGQRP